MSETPDSADLVVVGFGAAGLAATLSALETAERRESNFSVVVLERAPKEDRGGNTRWSTAGIHPDTHAPGFVESFASRTQDADAYVRTLAKEAAPTLAWLGEYGLDFESGPRTFMTSDDPDLQPVGGGAGIIDALATHVESATMGRFFGPGGSKAIGAQILYETTAHSLVTGEDGTISGVVVRTTDGRLRSIRSPATIIASGGFEGNPEMMTQYIGYVVPTVSRGGSYNRGEGIRMALAAGAKPTGQWSEFHPLPADPRSGLRGGGLLTFAAVMETVPYGIVVNSDGDRFLDEGAHSMNELYDILSRAVQKQEGQIAYAIYDHPTFDIPGYRAAVAKDEVVGPYSSDTLDGLAGELGIEPHKLTQTLSEYNNSVLADSSGFDPFRPDGLATNPGLRPPKSNWARAINQPPYYAYPITCSIVFTFGGIGTNEHAEVVSTDDVPIPGLHAAGEVTGLYHDDYVGTTAVLRSLVFGKIAGVRAVEYALANRPGVTSQDVT